MTQDGPICIKITWENLDHEREVVKFSYSTYRFDTFREAYQALPYLVSRDAYSVRVWDTRHLFTKSRAFTFND